MSTISQLSKSISNFSSSFVQNIGNDFKAINAGIKSSRSDTETRKKANSAALRVFTRVAVVAGVVAAFWALTPLMASLAIATAVSTFVLGHDFFVMSKAVNRIIEEKQPEGNFLNWPQELQDEASKDSYIYKANEYVKCSLVKILKLDEVTKK